MLLALSVTISISEVRADRKPTENEKADFVKQFVTGCLRGKNMSKILDLMGGNKKNHPPYCACVADMFAGLANISDFNPLNRKSRLLDRKLNLQARDQCLNKTFPVTERNYEKLVKQIDAALAKWGSGIRVGTVHGNIIVFHAHILEQMTWKQQETLLMPLACALIHELNIYDTYFYLHARDDLDAQSTVIASLRSCGVY
jgi:hypothetical protein